MSFISDYLIHLHFQRKNIWSTIEMTLAHSIGHQRNHYTQE